jgi:hypothetical protein
MKTNIRVYIFIVSTIKQVASLQCMKCYGEDIGKCNTRTTTTHGCFGTDQSPTSTQYGISQLIGTSGANCQHQRVVQCSLDANACVTRMHARTTTTSAQQPHVVYTIAKGCTSTINSLNTTQSIRPQCSSNRGTPVDDKNSSLIECYCTRSLCNAHSMPMQMLIMHTLL